MKKQTMQRTRKNQKGPKKKKKNRTDRGDEADAGRQNGALSAGSFLEGRWKRSRGKGGDEASEIAPNELGIKSIRKDGRELKVKE